MPWVRPVYCAPSGACWDKGWFLINSNWPISITPTTPMSLQPPCAHSAHLPRIPPRYASALRAFVPLGQDLVSQQGWFAPHPLSGGRRIDGGWLRVESEHGFLDAQGHSLLIPEPEPLIHLLMLMNPVLRLRDARSTVTVAMIARLSGRISWIGCRNGSWTRIAVASMSPRYVKAWVRSAA